MHTIPRTSFNDEDVYVYSVASLTLVQRIPRSHGRDCDAALARGRHEGTFAERGWQAKYLGLRSPV